MSLNNTIQQDSRKSLFGKIFKYVLIGIGFVIFLGIVCVLWIYFSVFSGPGPIEISDFHPFKSANAKVQYLAFEDKMAKKWPVLSEEKLVQTSFGKTFMRVSGPINEIGRAS